ncbi:hypothetical protein [Marinobacter sp.]|uniref:phage tail tip fiber protein n=1 Tax=Marinobacter sp. TaxID=50741 RepID=UPI003A8E47F0
MSRLPAIPPSREKNLTVEKLKELVEIWKGDRGDPLDRVVSYRDLVNLKLGRVSPGRVLQAGDATSPPPTSVGALTNLTASGGFHVIFLDWDGVDQPNYSYTEIWRSSDDNLGNAVLVATSQAGLYPDVVDGNTGFYYWVRAVSTTGHPGPYNATAGTYAQSAIDPDYVIEQLAGLISESELAQELLTPIQAIPGIQQSLVTLNDEQGAISGRIDTVAAIVDDNTAAVETKASAQVVTGLQGEVQSIQSKYTIKLDVNGYVSGIGLMNDGATSEMVVASNAVYFIDPGQSITAFNPQTDYSSLDALRNTQFVFGYATVEGQTRFAINVPAYIPEATITTAMIKDAVITGAKIKDATINGAKINLADIWDLSIGNEMRSANYVAGQSGWRVTQGGFAEFGSGTFRGHVEMQSGYISDSVQIGGVLQYNDFSPGNFIRNGQATLSYSAAMTNAQYMNDGVRSISGNYWEIPGGVQYLQADLGEVRFVNESRMFFYALDGRRYKYAVAVSDDGLTWDYLTGSGPSDGSNATGFVWSRPPTGGYFAGYEFPTIMPIGTFTRYVRVWMGGNTVNAGNHGYEWELYGAGGGGEDPYTASVGTHVKDWVRPGSTLINGNKIYTGDAYVDTLQIKGQAVTFPSWAQTGSSVSNGGSWTTRLTVNVPRTGAPVAVFVQVYGHINNSYSSGGAVQVRVLRGSTVIGSFTAADARFLATTEAGNLYGGGDSTANFFLDTSNSSGNTAYSVQISHSGPSSSTTGLRRIMVIEMKR